MKNENLADRQFGPVSERYLTSAVHARGEDLQRLRRHAEQLRPTSVLDLDCGAGHVSFSLAGGGVPRIVACDVSRRMLATVAAEAASGMHPQIETALGSADALPFDARCFDWVVTRFSAHHWLHLDAALDEVTRVLRPEGRLIVIDVVAPEWPLLDTMLQSVELLRDASHVRNYRISEWRRALHDHGYAEREHHAWRLHMNFSDWVKRIETPPERIAALRVLMDDWPAAAREHFALQADYSFDIDAAWFDVSRPTNSPAAAAAR